MLKGFKKAFLLASLTSVIVMALVFVVVKAGNLTPPSSPASSSMHSLSEIYNSLAGTEITYTGSASTNDLVVGGTFDNLASIHFAVEIDAISPANTFRWSDDGGVNWDQSAQAIDGNPFAISHGVTVNFTPATVHVVGDRWDFYKQIADENGNIVEQLKYISGMTLQQMYNNSTAPVTIANSATSTANSVLTIKKSDTGAGKIIELQDSTNAVVFSVSKTGEVVSGSSSNLVLNAGSGQIKAAAGDAFYTAGGHPIREVGEEIYRASMPIFGYDYPAQTAFASFSNISRSVILDANSFPTELDGTTRIYKIGIRYATEGTDAESQWQVWNGAQVSIFNVPASTIADLGEGTIYITPSAVTLPGSGAWYLRIRSLSGTGKAIRVYQIDLIAYDVVD